MSRLEAYNKVLKMPLDEDKLEAMQEFLKNFPIATYRKEPFGNQGFIYYNIYRQLASAYFASSQNEKLFALIPDMDFAVLNEIYRWNIDRIFALNRLPLDKIYALSHPLIDELIKKQADLSYMDQTRYSPLQARELATVALDNKLSIHIRLLDKMGRFSEALPYLSKLSQQGTYTDAALNEAHMDILKQTGQQNMVLPVLEQGVRASAATPGMVSALKALYIQRTGSDAGFEAYLESLKSREDVEKLKASLKSKLISIPYKAFKLTGPNNKAVNSADWKDRIVVIDFWATWCFPCKMAFPGMQQLVDRYSQDDKVSIYFVSTMEKSKTYKMDITKYLHEAAYRFDVLYDDLNPQTGSNDRVFKSMTPIFNSSAIPRKVVIKDGVIRYTAEGYSGSPSQLLDELSYVIEILKAE
jgi:thiol-disulfide isomerase/thioredoxin